MTNRHIAERAVELGAMQKVSELETLLDRLSDTKPKTVIEIGGMHGGTAWAWWQIMHEPKTLIVVDMFVLEGRMENAPIATVIQGDSHEWSTWSKVQDSLPTEADFLFIDGDHSYVGVRADFQMYAPLVRLGGTIALHDVSVEQPARVRDIHDVIPYWNQLKALHGDCIEIFDETEGAWGGIGVLSMPPNKEQFLSDAAALDSFTPLQRDATVPSDDVCEICLCSLVEGEDRLCGFCAGRPHG